MYIIGESRGNDAQTERGDMTITTGDRLPNASFLELGSDGPVEVASSEIFAGRTVVAFGLPGAFTRTCSATHLPSFLRTAAGFRAAGVDEIVCIAVNDPFVMAAWDAATGASASGVRLLADPEATFTDAIGLKFDAPAVGLIGRSQRYSLLARDGVVAILNVEPGRECSVSAGETLLAAL